MTVLKLKQRISLCSILFFFFFYPQTGVTFLRAEILPSNRCVLWKGNVGIQGDIPHRLGIFANVRRAPYGAAGDGLQDDTQAIQRAINDCPAGQVVYLPSGTYKITRGLNIKSFITLRGAGMDSTIIKGAAGLTDNHLIAFVFPDYDDNRYFQSGKPIIDGLYKGSTRITVTAHGYRKGDILLIDQVNDDTGDPVITATGLDGTCTWCSRANGTRVLGQVVEVASVPDANTLQLDIPLYYDFNQTKLPQTSRINPAYLIQSAGLEKLQVDNSLSYSDNQENYGTVYMHAAINCWLLNVKINMVYKTGLVIRYGSYRDIVRGCQITKSYQYSANAGYGMWLSYGVSACLIENNIFNELSAGFIFNGANSGNVISYNYFTDIISTDYPNSVRDGIVAHGGHPMMNLFEGNYLNGPCIAADLYWGSSSHNTYLRNRVIIDVGKTGGTANIALWKHQTFHNFIGNILGTKGHETVYENNDLYEGKMIYCLDYADDGPQNGKTARTILRHGNYDYVSDRTIWEASIADHQIPPSYYLSEKPSWWGSFSWPAIGPDSNPMTGAIPAQARFQAGNRVPDPPGRLRFLR